MDIKRIKGLQRAIAKEQLAKYGPQHGKAGQHRSKKDKANCPKRQRKQKDWQ